MPRIRQVQGFPPQHVLVLKKELNQRRDRCARLISTEAQLRSVGEKLSVGGHHEGVGEVQVCLR